MKWGQKNLGVEVGELVTQRGKKGKEREKEVAIRICDFKQLPTEDDLK